LFRGVQKGVFFHIGNGRNLHHVIYIDDLIAGLELAATKEEAVGQLFILAGAAPITTNEMVTAVAAAVNSPAPKIRLPLPPFLWLAAILETTLRPLGIQPPLHRRRMDFFKKSFVLSAARATAVLNFTPHVDFQKGAVLTANWYKKEGYLQIDR
jgi:dihydroflavonol-4-reductase